MAHLKKKKKKKTISKNRWQAEHDETQRPNYLLNGPRSFGPLPNSSHVPFVSSEVNDILDEELYSHGQVIVLSELLETFKVRIHANLKATNILMRYNKRKKS